MKSGPDTIKITNKWKDLSLVSFSLSLPHDIAFLTPMFTLETFCVFDRCEKADKAQS